MKVSVNIQSLATALKVKPEDLEARLKNGDDSLKSESEIESVIANEIQTYAASRYTDGNKTGFGRGEKAKQTELMKKVAELLEVSDIDSIEEGISLFKENAKTHTKIDPKSVRDSEEYKNMLASHKIEVEKLKSDHQLFVEKTEQERIVSKVRDKVTLLFEGYVIPSGDHGKNLINMVVANILSGKRFSEENGTIQILAEDGTIQKDSAGHPVELDSFAKSQIGSFFEVKQGDGRRSPNDGNHKTNIPVFSNPQGKMNFEMPKNYDEMNQVADSIKDEGERISYLTAADAHLMQQQQTN